MATQGPETPCHAPVWDPARLATGLAAAGRYARAGGRRMALSRADRDDLQQDILLVLVERSGRFDPERGSWAAFAALIARHVVADRVRAQRAASQPVYVDLDLDNFPAGASATQCDTLDADLALDLVRVAADIPVPSRHLLDLIRATADVAAAQRQAPQSCAAFYRALAELRCWLRAAGLRPTRAASTHALRSAGR